MQVLNETHTKVVSGGLTQSQSTTVAVLSTQAILGMSVLGACKLLGASFQGPMVTHGWLPTANILSYVLISELSNWYYAKEAKA